MSEAIRRDAVTCALAAIAAVDPDDLVRRALRQHQIGGAVSLIAVGKAAGPMAAAALAALGDAVRRGVVIAPETVSMPVTGITCFVGGHPVPDENGATAARAALALATELGDDDTMLCLISGGASSLMTLPAGALTVADIASTTTLLLRAGATIQELNCVRKHLDALKGGRLAAIAHPARVVALILSDVVGDSLSVIASGPTVADPTTVADAVAVLDAYKVRDAVPAAVREYLESGTDESPKPGATRLDRAASFIIGSNVTAANAACRHAESMGYTARVVTTSLTGEARDVGAVVVRDTREELARTGGRVALVYAGETTVTVRGTGTGGRNQELVLGAAMAMDGLKEIAVASLGTDGIDGPTDAAGAVADGESVGKGRAHGLDPDAALAANDTYSFWKAIGGLIRTGRTGTNVMDVIVALAESPVSPVRAVSPMV